MLPLISSQRTTCLVFAAIASVLVGCKPAAAPKTAPDQTPGDSSLQAPASAHRPPGTAELANFLRATLPPDIKLVEVKNDPPVRLPNAAPGSDSWRYNVRLSLAPVEDELGPVSTQEAQAFQATLDKLNSLVVWSEAYGRSPYASLYPGFTVEARVQSILSQPGVWPEGAPQPAAPQLLRVIHPKDRPHPPIYAKMAAEWQVDHWQYRIGGATMPADDGAQYRSAFTGPLLIQGDPATEHYVAAAKGAIAQAEPKRAAIEEAYKSDLRKATQPGTSYKGQISHGSSTMPAEVRFIAPTGDYPGFARFEMRLPATGYVYTVSAKLAERVPNLPSVAAGNTTAIPEQAEPTPRADLTISYERIDIPHPFPENAFATDFYYHAHDTSNAPLNVRNHQLKGKAAVFLDGPGFVLSAQQVP